MGVAAVLAGEAFVARHRRYAQPELGLALRATIGRAGAPPLRLVLLGDSSALGVGVDRLEDTIGGQLANLLAEGPTGRRVHLSSVGVSGSRSTDLATQVARALLGERPDVALILIGANDATGLRGPPTRLPISARRCTGCVRRASRWWWAPAPTSARCVPSRLRCARWSAGPGVGWPARRPPPCWRRAARSSTWPPRPGRCSGPTRGRSATDGFHPSADGYRVWAHALLPAIVAAAAATTRR